MVKCKCCDAFVCRNDGQANPCPDCPPKPEKVWSVETMSVKETIDALDKQGQYLCTQHNDNYGQGVCERAIEFLKGKPEPSGEFTKEKERLKMLYDEKRWLGINPLKVIEYLERIEQLQAENKLKANMIAAMYRDIRKQNDIIIELEALKGK